MQTVDLGQVVGKSAYDGAVEAGYRGEEAEFYAALASIGDVQAALDAALHGTGGGQ